MQVRSTALLSAAALVFLALGACADADPTGPAVAPRFTAVAASPGGNPHVQLLPPLGVGGAFTGTFDRGLEPEVLIYRGSETPCASEGDADCAPLVAHFTSGGSGAERVRASDAHYHVNWQPARDARGPHRIAIRVGAQTIALFDVDLARSGAVPIQFRIEQGALALAVTEVGAAGGSVSAGGGTASLEIPAGALNAPTTITVEQGEPGAADERVVGSVYEFGPDGTVFDEPVTITLAYDAADLPAGVSARLLRLHTFVDGVWQLVPGSTVDVENGTVSGETSHFSTYAALPAGFVVVSSGEWHSCGLTTSGSAWCWGSNSAGQLGAVSTATCTDPLGAATGPCATQAVEVQGGIVFQSIEAGNQHTCGVAVTGEAYCWGDNSRGQFGNGTLVSSALPVVAAPGLTFRSVSADFMQTCGIETSGAVYCWGQNNNRQLGSATTETCAFGVACSTTPLAVGITASSVDVGLGHVCARTVAGEVYCWGWNVFGQAGTGSTSANAPPTLIPGGPYESVSAGAIHNCVIAAGAASCFGGDLVATGALGNGTRTRQLLPTAVAGGIAFSQIDASNGNYIFTHTCGVSTLGSAYCWGANRDGQLGVAVAPEVCTHSAFPSYDCVSVPTAVSGGHSFRYVTAGVGFTCGYTTAGDVYCWGRNDLGQLGNGSTAWTRSPVRIATAP